MPQKNVPKSVPSLRRHFPIAIVVAGLASAGCEVAPRHEVTTADAAFRIYTQQPGVYRVSYEDLAEAGEALTWSSDELAVSSGGQPVPIWVEDGGDGTFGPGDHFELRAERLAGEEAWNHEFSPHNVYWLRRDAGLARRFVAAEPTPGRRLQPGELYDRQHHEIDRLFIRLSSRDVRQAGNGELWYWAKLTQIDPQPFRLELDLRYLALHSASPVRLRIALRGISQPRRRVDQAHHRVEALLNGETIGFGEWNGKTVHMLEISDLTAEDLEPGLHTLELRVPKRLVEATGDPLIDVVMVNWIEVEYPRTILLGPDQIQVAIGDPAAARSDEADEGGLAFFTTATDVTIVAHTADGRRIESHGEPMPRVPGHARHWLPLSDRDEATVSPPGALLEPVVIGRDAPSDWAWTDHQADYLMITHPRLREAIEPLADLHRERGLTVSIVDVEDLYDEFNHGVPHPKALRDFVAHAYHRWQPPRPQFVLLVGDASWDTKNATVDDANYANWTDMQLAANERFPIRETPTAGSAVNNRNLVPSWNYTSSHGHSASDNYFVAIDGDDFLPDLAIGRLPVVEPEEVEAIVAKIDRYLNDPEPGPWRREVLWITNESLGFQRQTDTLVEVMDTKGYRPTRVYPKPEEADNSAHQARLQQAFNDGKLLTYFYGHGGSNIWRTGPPDYTKNHDLFTLEHVAELAPHARQPFVLSMTCFSAPFDHPNSDSIGETFLRSPGRGAIAFFGASWRNAPSPAMARTLLEEVAVPGTPIGTAIMRAKRYGAGSRVLVETYNLLGDPALPLAAPRPVELQPQDGSDLVVVAELGPDLGRGRMIVEWLDDEDELLRRDERKVRRERVELAVDDELEGVRSVRLYAWNDRVDAAGSYRIPATPPTQISAEEAAEEELRRERKVAARQAGAP